MFDSRTAAVDCDVNDSETASGDAHTGNNPVALIVDDEELILELMEHHLENAGYDVVRARDGSEALAHLEQSVPAIVILDVMMPIVDGNEVLRRIRETPKWAHLPVIMLTMRDREEDAVEAFQTGVSDYVAKPFMVGDLIERANRLIEPQTWHAQEPSLRAA